MNNIYIPFETQEDIATTLAHDISQILEKSILLNDKATLLLSGGNTPKLFLNKLSNIKIDWEKVTVGLVDERIVDISNKDSNEFLIKNELCINNAKVVNFIGMFNKNDLILYKNTFSKIDVLVLGMGTDGHTASLFPYNEKLEKAYDLDNDEFTIFITPSTAPYERISLTLKSILSADAIFLHIEGKEKIKVYNEVIKSNDTLKYPIIKVLNSEKEIKVYAHE
ncbi:6-phosphogluconolactonase [Arcobacteraceae bacterium]|nr:6-phosphogluconolactonase [Arcobacteraceae bacterium]